MAVGTGNGSTSPSVGPHNYNEDIVVDISANPASGWAFDYWEGDVNEPSDQASNSVTMDASKTVTANFLELPRYDLIVNDDGNGSASGDGNYYQGQVVNINANPDSGWQFDNWSGSDTSTIANVNDPTTTITMNGNYTITANFSVAPDVTLTMAVTGSGSTDPEVGDHTYPANTVVQITATPDSGWLFDNWTGAVANSNSATTTVTMNSNKTVTANFSPAAPVTLTMAVTGNGSTDPTVGEHEYSEGEVVTITATPDVGWQFDDWTGDVANTNSATTTVTMDTDETVTANFSPAPDVTLTMAVNGNGSTSPAVGDHTYPIGTVVNIAAIADSGWQFDSWSGDVADPNSAITTVTMNSNKTVTANFSEIPIYTLTMAVNGNGSTSPPVGEYAYSAGTVVPIAAIEGSGWEFDSWTGDVADPNSASTTVLMDADKTVTANFKDITPPLILAISVSNTTKTGADISWVTDEPSNSQVDYRASPGELTPLDETLVTEHLVHLTDLTPATTYYYKVMSRDEAGNLSVSDEYTFTTMGLPATFAISDWAISLSEVDTGTEVTISFLLTNTGDLAGSYQVAIAVDGVVEATREVTLDAEASEEITFTTTKDIAGTYLVSVNGLTVSFTVVPPPPAEINWWLIVGIIAGVILLLILSILLTRRTREKAEKWPEKEPGEKVTGKAKALVSAAVGWIDSRQPFKPKEAKEMAEGGFGEAAIMAVREAKESARREAEEAKKAMEAERNARKEAEREAKEKAKREAAEAKERAKREAEEAKEMAKGGVEEAAIMAVRKARESARREAEEAKKAMEAEEKARLEPEREAEEKAGQEVEREAEKTLRQQPGNDIRIEIKEGGGVLTVKALAVANLKKALHTLTKDPKIGVRFMPSTADPSQFEMILDREKEGDQVVESDGLKILLIRPELAPALEGMTIDCQETPQGARFTMSKHAPGS